MTRQSIPSPNLGGGVFVRQRGSIFCCQSGPCDIILKIRKGRKLYITLPPDLAKIVQRKVDARLYKTPDEVVRMALEVLVEYDREDEARLKVLQDMVREADESYERGESIEFTTMEELLKEDD